MTHDFFDPDITYFDRDITYFDDSNVRVRAKLGPRKEEHSMTVQKCEACNEGFREGQAMTVAGAGQITAIVHAGCVKRFRAHIYGRDHVCPMCNGAGEINDESKPKKNTVRDEDSELADAYNGSMHCGHRYKDVIVGYAQKNCGFCDGWGYRDRAAKPIIKVTKEIIGYE